MPIFRFADIILSTRHLTKSPEAPITSYIMKDDNIETPRVSRRRSFGQPSHSARYLRRRLGDIAAARLFARADWRID